MSSMEGSVPDAAGPVSRPADGEDRPHVLLVEDSVTDAEEAKFFLERSGKLVVDLGEVFPEVEDYSSVPLNAEVKAVIVDQFLADNTGVPYDGVNVADHLRSVAPALPVFVLTNDAGDLEQQASSVDMVITKGNMRRHTDTYIGRILRRIGQYQASLSERQLRLQQLLDLELADQLSPEEVDELEMLRRDVERASDLTLRQVETRNSEERLRNDDRTRTLHEMLEEMREIKERLEDG
jgi:CheY-like chemotaxis protein